MPEQTRAEYLRSEISRLEATIAHLQNAGVEIYNNRPSLAFKDCPETIAHRQWEKHSSEIYEKKGEDFLAEFKEKLKEYQSELAELRQASSD